MAPEIERKWLVRELPDDFQTGAGAVIGQGYLTIGEGGSETRIRSRAGKYTLTTKSGSGMIRAETEIELTVQQFDTMWPATKGARITKVRHTLPADGDLTIEVDVYTGQLAGLIVAEVEFPDAAAAQAYTPPPWFGAEVTDDGAYKNHALARSGLPHGARGAGAPQA